MISSARQTRQGPSLREDARLGPFTRLLREPLPRVDVKKDVRRERVEFRCCEQDWRGCNTQKSVISLNLYPFPV